MSIILLRLNMFLQNKIMTMHDFTLIQNVETYFGFKLNVTFNKNVNCIISKKCNLSVNM